MNMSAGGAAFLAAAEDAPLVGQRLVLSEMQASDRLVREDARPLPPYARVLRRDDDAGVTRRIAVRFEMNADAPREAATSSVISTACSHVAAARPLAPPTRNDPQPEHVLARDGVGL